MRWRCWWSCSNSLDGELEGFLVGHLGAGEFVGDRAVAEDEQSVADREQLWVLGGDDDDSAAGVGKLPDDLDDLGFGADVDAGGWFVHDEDAGLGAEPLGDDDLLL